MRCLLLEGGGNDVQYEGKCIIYMIYSYIFSLVDVLFLVPLFNGCEILIASTPFCILRMIGNGFTNLERLRYLVFDQANILVEKFPRQIKTLVNRYHNCLKLNDQQPVAQFILMSNNWSNKLNVFLDSYMMSRVIISTNKLESSYFGRTQHVIYECEESSNAKFKTLLEILKKISYTNDEEHPKHTIIFTNKNESVIEIGKALINVYNYANVNLVHRGVSDLIIKKIETKWNEIDSKPSLGLKSNENKNLILIVEQHSINYLNIDNARCILHFDFPKSKAALSERLWFMRKYFPMKKTLFSSSIANENNEKLTETDAESVQENVDIELIGDTELVKKENERILSFILLTKKDKEYSEGFLNYLKRIGFDEKNIPKILIEMASRRCQKKEKEKSDYPLCPYIKSFGECMSINKTSCPFRHKPNLTADAIRLLDENFPIPSEGYINFKVAHVADTNHFFVHLLSHQDLKRETLTEYNKFMKFDADLQFYFSNPDNIKDLTNFKQNEIYAFKDIESSIFKRIAIKEVIRKDDSIVYEIKVKAIDYGAKYKISTHDLIKLPSKFQKLPPQVIKLPHHLIFSLFS